MGLNRRHFMALGAAVIALPAFAADRDQLATDVMITWNRLVLELVRHTATYSPPVAARAFGYLGVLTHEVFAACHGTARSLGAQLNGYTTPPQGHAPADLALAMHHALSDAAATLFGNTGPMGQRAHAAMTDRLGARLRDGLDRALIDNSAQLGRKMAKHLLAWAQTDGGASVVNMGFPIDPVPAQHPRDWVPTSLVAQHQAPLLPEWGQVRPFAMPSGVACTIPPHPDYDPTPGSPFDLAAREVLDISRILTPEQKLIARFWADEPMLSPTPPGHWLSLLLDIAERDRLPPSRLADALARLGAAQADAFIACWQAKYQYNLLRPVTYIQRHLQADWQPLLTTPPFPEYPSGHSTQSGASAEILTALFGDGFAFDDATHVDDGLPVRSFGSFWDAANEAAMSRLYGGIHFRFGNEAGTEQGRCVGAFAAALRTI
jgi:hypothetical protein